MNKPLLLNNANVWETLGVLQMKYSGKLLLFFAVEAFKCLGDRDKNWIKNPCVQSFSLMTSFLKLHSFFSATPCTTKNLYCLPVISF